jgi:NarL family two-component system response regulator LiaR
MEAKMAGSRIRVIIVDDHEMFRTGLAILLEAFVDLSLIGVATNGREAIRLCDTVETDVVLMDLTMPKMNGITATRLLRRRHPQVRVVALVSFKDEELVEEVMAAGATSYVLKCAPVDQVVSHIRAAARDAAPGTDASVTRSGHGSGGARSSGPEVPQLRKDMA